MSRNMSRGDYRRGRRKKRHILRNLCIFFISLVLLVAGGAFVYMEVMLGRVNIADKNESDGALFSSTAPDPGHDTGEEDQGLKKVNGLYHDDKIINILVMGVDDYQENDVGRTDSMILLSLDTRHKKLKMTSIMRDTYVEIPGKTEKDRINTAYSTGGPDLLVETIETLFGVDIDRWAVITFDSFEKIIDAMGGVEITLTQEEADQINHESGDPRHNLTEGTYNLSGLQARYYSRIRHTAGDDFMRTQRQRNVISAIVEKFKTADLVTVHNVLYECLPYVTTNLQKDEIVTLASGALEYLDYELEENRIPGDGQYTPERVLITGIEQEVLVPDIEACAEQLVSFIYEDEPVSAVNEN